MTGGERRISRRTLLGLGAGVVGGAAVVAAVEASDDGGQFGRAAPSPNASPTPAARRPVTGTVTVQPQSFASARRSRQVAWVLMTPDGVAPAELPVVLVLHGRGDDARSAVTGLDLPSRLTEHIRAGNRPLAAVSVDGGTAYWHPRADRDDPLGMLTGELLPRVADRGLRTDALGTLGWSMGGYGALLLARESHLGRLGGVRVGAAAASSPALFDSFGDAAPGAFDGAADYARWGDLAAHPSVGGVPLSVSCGTSDPFAAQTRRYRANAVPTPEGGMGPGGHDFGYWRARVPDQLRFLAQHLR